MNRRDLIKLTSLTLLSTRSGLLFSKDSKERYICTIGIQPPGMMPFRGQKDTGSILHLLSLETMKRKVVPLEMRGAHSILSHRENYIVVGNREELQVVTKAFVPSDIIQAPAGFEFGGHAISYDEDHIVSALRPARMNKKREEGIIVKINLREKTIQKVGRSGGFGPHDIATLSGGLFAVANYGNEEIKDLETYSSLNPTISFYDSRSNKHQFTVQAPKLGSVSHICEGWEGTLIALPAKLSILTQESINMVTQATQGQKPMITLGEIAEGKVAFPSPVLILDLKTRKWTSILPHPEKHRRPQSIAFDQKTQTAWITFSYSEEILRMDQNRKCQYISAFDLGMEIPRGVCIGPDGLVYISGQSRVITALNPTDMSVVGRYDTRNFDATHVQPI